MSGKILHTENQNGQLLKDKLIEPGIRPKRRLSGGKVLSVLPGGGFQVVAEKADTSIEVLPKQTIIRDSE